MKKTQCTNYTR